jgi:hypothetical protein
MAVTSSRIFMEGVKKSTGRKKLRIEIGPSEMLLRQIV